MPSNIVGYIVIQMGLDWMRILQGVARNHAERSHSHRGFSPVAKGLNVNAKPFQPFLVAIDHEKPLETVQGFFFELDHRAKATV